MSEEKREILEHLVEYLQDKIDTGYHKIFYNDDMYDEKTIDCINAINYTLEENKRLNKENEELKKIQCTFLGTGCRAEIETLNKIIKEVREYIMSKLITEWDIENDGYVSGSDLPADAITPILEILDKENKQ